MKTKLLLLALLIITTTSLIFSQTVPTAPTITGVATDSQLSVSFTPATDGGSPIIGYKYSTDGGVTFRKRLYGVDTSPFVIYVQSADSSKLVTGTIYNIQIKAVNLIGDGDASASFAATYIYLGGGEGTEAKPYLIGTQNDLSAFKTAINTTGNTTQQTAFYKLKANIDMSSLLSFYGGIGNNAANAFKGNFDGAGHKISGLIAGSPTTRLTLNSVGLFNVVTGGASISNLWVDVAYYTTAGITANSGGSAGAGLVNNVNGAVVGNVLINNCKVTGIIDVEAIAVLSIGGTTPGTLSTSTRAIAGGILGNPNGAGCTVSIVNSIVNAIVVARNNSTIAGNAICGGIVGEIKNVAGTTQVVNCSAAGSVSAISALGNSYAGGIASEFYMPTATVYILNCMASNTVSSNGMYTTGNSGTPAAGIAVIGNINCMVKYCMALNPSITSVNNAVPGTPAPIFAVNRIQTVSNLSTNADFNYAKADMAVKTTLNGVGPTDLVLVGKTVQGKDGADLSLTDPIGDATTKLNEYIALYPTFSGVSLINWVAGAIPNAMSVNQIVSKPINYKIANGILNVSGVEGSKQLSIYSISGAICKQLLITDSYSTSLSKGIYILKVEGFAASKLVVL